MDTTVLQLKEDNEYLELKIKYIQSVGTIFRQKITLLLREVLRARSDGPALTSALEGLMDEISAAEDTTTKTKDQLSKPSLAVDGADYWRDQFLSLMRDTKPTSLADAQHLCNILQEKNLIAVREANLRREYALLEGKYNALRAQLQDVLTNKAVSAEDAVRELYRMKVEALEKELTPEAAEHRTNQLRQYDEANARLEAQNKVLRLRISELKEKLNRLETADTGVESSQQRIEQLLSEVKLLKSEVAVKDAEIRRHVADLLHAERNIELREQNLLRTSGKITALEAEANFALKEAMADTDTLEVAFLQRTVDTFELHSRRMEKENATLVSRVRELEDTVASQSGEILTLKAQLEGCLRCGATNKRTLETIEIEREQRQSHRQLAEELNGKLSATVEALSQIHCIREMSMQMSRLHSDLSNIESKDQNIKKLRDLLDSQKRLIDAFREELNRCCKFQVPPNPTFFEDSYATASLHGGRVDSFLKEVVVRQQGDWSEVRDVVSGKLRYLTLNPTGTPFEPKAPLPVAPEPEPEPVKPAPPSPKKLSKASTPSSVSPGPDPKHNPPPAEEQLQAASVPSPAAIEEPSPAPSQTNQNPNPAEHQTQEEGVEPQTPPPSHPQPDHHVPEPEPFSPGSPPNDLGVEFDNL